MAFDFEQQRSRSNQYNADLLAQAKANYKGEPGVGGVRGFDDYVKGSDGLRIGNVTSGARGNIGSGNSNWMVNPDTGREERAFAGSDGLYYLESDLINKFGSIENAAKAFGQAHPELDDRSPLYWSGAQQSNDTFSGKDGLRDLVTIAGMAAIPVGGALGLLGAGAGATGVGDAVIAGGTGTDALTGIAASGGAGGGTGLTAGTVGTGLTAGSGATVGAGLGEGALGGGAATTGASGALAPGYFAGETAYPIIGGATAGTGAAGAGTAAGLSSAATTGAAAGGGTALSRILSGEGTAADYASIAGAAAPGLLGAYAASQQTGALKDIAAKYAEYGAPSRGRYEASMTPGFDVNSIPGYSGAVDTASKALLARLSATGGNPYGNPSGLVEANKQIISGTALPAVQNYQNQNATTGFGTTLNTAGTMGQNAIASNANVYNAIGGAAADVINPPQTLMQQYAALKRAGLA